jgi:PIN domain nuclease of toxin-antitoxin system
VKLLLDTHAWLWSQLAPERFSTRTRKRLLAADTELWISPISVWEVLLLAERRRVELRPSAELWIETFFERVPVREAALTRDVALKSRRIRVAHDDPADRFLAATAASYDLVLLTADQRLLEGSGYRTLACD